MSQALISAEDLQTLLKHDSRVVVLDASYGVPDAAGSFASRHIQGARLFDIDTVADPLSPYPHTLPSEADFAGAVGALGIRNETPVIVYDQNGMAFAAARVWWMFRVFGHDNVRVLDGGLPAWLMAGMETVSGPAPQVTAVEFTATFQPDLYRSYDDVETASETGSEQIIDARGAARFDAPQRSMDGDVIPAHIPGSVNLPFAALLDHTGKMKNTADIAEILKTYVPANDKKAVVSCGSGVTACVVALGFFQTGQKNTAVFDGSWAEWSDRQHLS